MQEVVVSRGNTDIIVSPLKQVSTDRPEESRTTAKDIKNIQSLNNYTNIFL